MDRGTRRDVGVATAIGGTLVVATLAVGQVFGPGVEATLRGDVGGGDGAPIRVAGEPAASRRPASLDALRARAAARDDATDGTAAVVDVDGDGRPVAGGRGSRDGGSADGAVRLEDGGRTTAPGVPSGDAPGSPAPGPGASPAPVDPPAIGPADPGEVGDDGRLVTAAVRLRVTDLSVTGTDSGTLRSGSEVRVRMATERDETPVPTTAAARAVVPSVASRAASVSPSGATDASTDAGPSLTTTASTDAGVPAATTGARDEARPTAGPATTTAADDGARTAAEQTTTGAGGEARSGTAGADAAPAAPLPDRLDVRIRLDDAAVAALTAAVKGSTGPKALRALVDLVGPRDGAAGPFTVRVRMQLTPAEKTRAMVTEADRTADGASNVVAVTAPIGPTEEDPGTPGEGPTSPDGPGGAPGTGPDDPGGTPGDGGTTDPGTPTGGEPAAPDPVPDGTAAPVEVLVPLPSGDVATTPDDGASVGVPIPAVPSAPADPDVPTTADAAVVVHLPAADEPIGGVPEDLTVEPPPVLVEPDPAPAGGATDPVPSTDDPADRDPAPSTGDDDAPPTGEDAPSTGGDTPTAGNDTPSTGDDAPGTGDGGPSAGAPAGGDPTPAPGEPAAGGGAPTGAAGGTPSEDPTPAGAAGSAGRRAEAAGPGSVGRRDPVGPRGSDGRVGP